MEKWWTFSSFSMEIDNQIMKHSSFLPHNWAEWTHTDTHTHTQKPATRIKDCNCMLNSKGSLLFLCQRIIINHVHCACTGYSTCRMGGRYDKIRHILWGYINALEEGVVLKSRLWYTYGMLKLYTYIDMGRRNSWKDSAEPYFGVPKQ